MILRALACDYDGTLATADRVGPAVLEALSRAREAALKLILVTGRAFFKLTRVCERLDLFDAVVAENGGVIFSDEELGRQLRKTENRWVRGELAELAQNLARPIEREEDAA